MKCVCGKAIKDLGWRAYPARVENEALVGTRPSTNPRDEGANTVIGPGVNLCLSCVAEKHPMTEEDEGA